MKREQEVWLGLEGGGSSSVFLAVGGDLKVLCRLEGGPGNLQLCTDAQLLEVWKPWARDWPSPTALCVGLPGLKDGKDHARARKILARLWPGVPAHVTSDLETAWRAGGPTGQEKLTGGRVLVLSGTGSCCFGRDASGNTSKIGGWGHLLGDKGSGFDIGMRALKACVYYYDRDGAWPSLGGKLLKFLGLERPEDLPRWVPGAGKDRIASLAALVLEEAGRKDRIAVDILAGAASSLGKDALSCAGRLAGPQEFLLAGGLLTQRRILAGAIQKRIQEGLPDARCRILRRETAWGAVLLARDAFRDGRAQPLEALEDQAVRCLLPTSSGLSPTEERNPRSMKLHRLSVPGLIRLFLEEEARTAPVLAGHVRELSRMIQRVTRCHRAGGRLIYVGAGTSGRLGVLDASECPPTFSTDPEEVQAVIAGGAPAITRAVEGAEDDREAGVTSMRERQVGPKDVVLGIAASGRTPFVWGALEEARARGAGTMFLCFNPKLVIPKSLRPDEVLCVDLGPEILTGSTRLKAGTATKQVLNLLTTAVMVRRGKVISNLMVDVAPTNVKLRERAVRILSSLIQVDEGEALRLLEGSRWSIPEAVRQSGVRKGQPSSG